MFSYDEYERLQTAAGAVERTSRGRLQLTGEDRRSYLHGLLTNDIVALAAGQGCYAALLTPQGRMISDMRVSELGDRVLIDLPLATASSVRARLADFVFSEDVEVQDVTDRLAQVGVYGPTAAGSLADLLQRPSAAATRDGNDTCEARRERLERLSLDANGEWRFGDATVHAIRSEDFGIAGFELCLPADAAAAFVSGLQEAGAPPVSETTLEVTRVEAGRPAFGADMDESTIPLEAGIEDRAISTTKGCYVGQEVIVRVLHRGQGRVAKRLVGVIADPADALQRGERLFVAGSDKEVGSVTSAVVSPRLRRPIALGYVRRELAEPGTLLTAGTEGSGRRVTVVMLPFTVPAAR